MRFLCDQMLVRLGRWLRAAGYDTLIASPGELDAHLIVRAEEEERVLLTRDRALLHLAQSRAFVLILPDKISDQASMLRQTLGLDWLAAPFTRCLIDNCPLEETRPGADIPKTARSLPGPFRHCPCCERDYWPGSHVRRMTARLALWNAGQAGHPPGQAS
jgi:hypothetical protein